MSKPTVEIWHGDNLPILNSFESDRFSLVYMDPPFNTGKEQSRASTRAIRDDHGDRNGFQGARYRTEVVGSKSYTDSFGDEYLAFLEPRLRECKRVLKRDGSLFFHIDFREAHYCKILLDAIFGRECFMNEIVWAYDYGGRSRTRWPAKHDTIFWYARDPGCYTFNYEAMDRIPYMAPGLVTPEKAARGKTPTDVWWHTIVSPTGKEKTGYPTQKPLGILRRILSVHTHEGDEVLDPFAGSGSTGAAATESGRSAVLIDSSEQAIATMESRLDTRARVDAPKSLR